MKRRSPQDTQLVPEAQALTLTGSVLPAVAVPALRSAIADLMHEGESENTRASYAAAMRYWNSWHEERFGSALELPTSLAVVLQFLVDHAQRQTPEGGLIHDLPPQVDAALIQRGVKAKPGPMALTTLCHRITVLSKAHTVKALPNPCMAPELKQLLASTRRAYAKRGERPASKAALVKEPLDAILATCDDSLKGLRDRALLLFAFSSGGRRRSEVVAATRENTIKVAPGQWVYRMGASKTDQAGDSKRNEKPVVGVAAQALEAWLAASKITSGAIFRGIRKGTTVAEPLGPSAVRKIVQERCLLAGIEGDFSAHSLRSGFVTEAGRRQIPLGDTMALTGHVNVDTVMRYFKSGSQLTGPAARLMDED